MSQMYTTAAKFKKLHYHGRSNLEFHSDLYWWHTFLTQWIGLTLLNWDDQDWTPNYIIQIDASGTWGCGSFWMGNWFQWAWPLQWTDINIMVKELVPIILSCAVWGKQLAGNRVLFECDNSSVVAAVNRQSTKAPESMRLLRYLWFFVAYVTGSAKRGLIAFSIACIWLSIT